MYEADYIRGGFMWLDHGDAERSVYSMLRRNKCGDQEHIVCIQPDTWARFQPIVSACRKRVLTRWCSTPIVATTGE